jgi:hypothetical protein
MEKSMEEIKMIAAAVLLAGSMIADRIIHKKKLLKGRKQ